MPKPNYQFEKRKRDMDKKAKKAEKLLRKKEAGAAKPEDGSEGTTGDTDAPAEAV